MAASRAHRKAVAGPVGALVAVAGDRQRAFENEQTGIELMMVLGIDRICLHAAIDHFGVALFAQFGLEGTRLICILPDVHRYLAYHRERCERASFGGGMSWRP